MIAPLSITGDAIPLAPSLLLLLICLIEFIRKVRIISSFVISSFLIHNSSRQRRLSRSKAAPEGCFDARRGAKRARRTMCCCTQSLSSHADSRTSAKRFPKVDAFRHTAANGALQITKVKWSLAPIRIHAGARRTAVAFSEIYSKYN